VGALPTAPMSSQSLARYEVQTVQWFPVSNLLTMKPLVLLLLVIAPLRTDAQADWYHVGNGSDYRVEIDLNTLRCTTQNIWRCEVWHRNLYNRTMHSPSTGWYYNYL